jgi:SAM-dependent methyltransferase
MTSTTPVQSPWTLGDFHIIGRMHNTGDGLCDDCNLRSGARVLDVACGSGNTALSAARHGARVTGLDLFDRLIEHARVRAQAEGFDIDFVVGNAEALPFEEAAFDCVLSTFGVMFAPDQQRAADELLRVCKPGGTIALSNWTLESFPGAMFGVAAKYGPPRPGQQSPLEWGTAAGLNRLFDRRVREMRVFDRSFRWHTRDFEEWFAIMRTYFGPLKMLFDNLPEDRATQACEDLASLTERYNRATDGSLAIHMAYVNVVIER